MLRRAAIAATLAVGGACVAGAAHAQQTQTLQFPRIRPPPEVDPKLQNTGPRTEKPKPPPPVKPVIHPVLKDIVLGEADAPVEIVEYASVTCAACQHFHASVLPDLKARYVLTGDAKFILRDYPTPPIPAANAGAALARCIGEAHYYDAIADLFMHQSDLIAAARTGELAVELLAVGKRFGLSDAEVEACVTDAPTLAWIRNQAEKAPAFSMPPAVFVNGERIDEPTLPKLRAAIDRALITARISSSQEIPAATASADAPPAAPH